MECPKCRRQNPENAKFCNECGSSLPKVKPNEDAISTTTSERKHVTVLFSDLTGYTAMAEKLDPEEVKEITSRIFSEISKIVSSYNGFIEKYAGDAVMAIFGVPKTHEDDPIRAVRAARKIHELVKEVSPEVEKKIGQAISMHTGITTGLVVTGEVEMARGTHGIVGDTINLASRLSNLAKPGEILVNADTYRQVEGHFTCEYRETTTVKGKADPVDFYQVLSQRDRPLTIHRLSGLRADMIGRDKELAELSDAVENLRIGEGRIISIRGAAGTGKSRLVEEFKAGIDLRQLQWIEGHAYSYTQNIPYFPLLNLLNRLLQIEEKDPPEKVRDKIESRIGSLVPDEQEIVPYVGHLYSLNYPDASEISPEHFKSRLQRAILSFLSALADKGPTVFFLEDLHWADPSFVELLRRACWEIRHPAIVLCNYRPTFSLFKVCQTSKFGNAYHEIRLENLPISIAQNMIKSLIKTDCIPGELEHWVNSKAEGNPFYIEELVNALIETETLIQENGSWKLSRSLTESNIPSSLHGLISSRIDRLEIQSKHALQEASVIGRVFLYKILKSITGIEQQRIDVELNNLERNDLIRMRSLHPDITYMFKHALTHEIVYNSLLKKKRREIHEHIAMVIERNFKDRLVEFYETLAFHFARGQSVTKAIDYLVKSGEKSLARYAVEEAHLYFRQAYNILSAKEELSESEKRIFIDMLNSWSYAYYYSGQIKDWINLLKSHQSLAESLEEESRLGLFYAWIGCALITECKPKKAYDYLLRSIEIGECTGDQKVIGYACTWLSWACGWQGLFDEGITYGLRAQQISESFPSDQYLYFKSLSAICYIYYAQGKTKELFEGTKRLLIYGDKTANSRSKVFGYWLNALGHLAKGEVELAQKESKKSIQAAADPFYSYFAQSSYGMSYLLEGKIKQAEDTFILLSDHCEKSGIELMSQFAKMFLSFINFANGNMNLGFRMIKDVQKALKENNMKLWYAISESMLGVLYTKFITGPSADFVSIIKNLSSVAKNAPFAGKKAEKKFLNAIEMFREMGAKVNLGQALLGLGRLHKAKKRNKDARKCFREAINIFQESNALLFLTQAREDLSLIE